MDKDSFLNLKRGFEEDKHSATQRRKKELEQKYMRKVYVGNDNMRLLAYEQVSRDLNRELEKLNKEDGRKLELLHFGVGGIKSAQNNFEIEKRQSTLRQKWIGKSEVQDNKASTPDVYSQSAEQQQGKEIKSERSELTVEFKNINEGIDRI